jgi:hypothetical protein
LISIVDVLRGFPKMVIAGTPDPERRKRRRKSLFSSHEGLKRIQHQAIHAVPCD